jgi:phage shock protein C
MTEQHATSPRPAQPPITLTPQPSAGPAPRRLVRSRDDRWLGGVCGGLAQYTGVDTTLIRLVVVVGTVLGLGSLLVAYLAAWLLMPMEPPSDWV